MKETALAKVLRVGRERQEEAASVRFLHGCLVIVGCDENGDGLWFDTRTAPKCEQSRVAAHVWFLESRDLLDRHPDNRAWIRCWARC